MMATQQVGMVAHQHARMKVQHSREPRVCSHVHCFQASVVMEFLVLGKSAMMVTPLVEMVARLCAEMKVSFLLCCEPH